MRGASLASLNAAEQRLTAALPAGAAGRRAFAADLFAMVDALDQTPALVRALANPNHSGQLKAEVAKRLMAGRQAEAATFIENLVTMRWSHDADLSDALEQLAFTAELAAIEAEESLVDFEQEIFAVDRFLQTNRALRIGLGDSSLPDASRRTATRNLFTGQVKPTTVAILERVFGTPRGRSPLASLTMLSERAAARRGRLVATLVTANSLVPAQVERIASHLTSRYGQPVQLNVSVDPALVGGMRVQIGDDLVDATIGSRLTALRRQVASQPASRP